MRQKNISDMGHGALAGFYAFEFGFYYSEPIS